MTPAEMKPLLRIARRRPVACAVVLTRDRQPVLLLDRKLKPRKLAAMIRQQARNEGIDLDAATIRFGRARVDGASDAGKVTFTVHKAAPSSMRQAILPALRGAGLQRCEFVVDQALEQEGEDGQEQHPEDEQEESAQAGTGATDGAPSARPDAPGSGSPGGPVPAPSVSAADPPATIAAPAAAVASSPLRSAPPLAPAMADRGAARADWRPDARAGLMTLGQRIAAGTEAGTPRRREVVGLADQAHAAIKAGDQDAAHGGMEALRRALDGAGAAAAGDTPDAQPPPGWDPGRPGAAADAAIGGLDGAARTPRDRSGDRLVAQGPGGGPGMGGPPSAPGSRVAAAGADIPGPRAATDGQPDAMSAAVQAPALARRLGVDPALFAGREEAALRVLLRLQGYAGLSYTEKRDFLQWAADQGFPGNGSFEGHPFIARLRGIVADLSSQPAWQPNVPPLPPDGKMGERLQKALEVAARDAPEGMRQELARLADPRNLAVMGGIITAVVLVHLTPLGWAADAVVALGMALAVGADVLTILSDLDTFMQQVNSRDGDPERAGKALAEAADLVGVNALVLLLTGGVSAGARRVAQRYARPPPGKVDVLSSGGGIVRMSAEEAAGVRKGTNLDDMIRSPEQGRGGSDQGRPGEERPAERRAGEGERPGGPFPGEEGPEGNPRMIFSGRAGLTPRQQGFLDRLPEFGSRVEVPAAGIRELDISALTASTGDEFAYFTNGYRVLLVRGGPGTVPVTPEVAAGLARDGWRWGAHTQPGDTPSYCRSSDGDRAVLQAMGQQSSRIYNSVGDSRTFTSAGDSLRGWLP